MMKNKEKIYTRKYDKIRHIEVGFCKQHNHGNTKQKIEEYKIRNRKRKTRK